MGIDLDALLSESGSDINMDNGARMVGCWNGLGKRAAGVDFADDPQPAKRAVAFSNRIKDSESFERSFPQVIETAITVRDNPENDLRCEVRHVDGNQNALERADHLAWLRAEPESGTCRVLSNARCLTEGIDVPALDAILFLHPRKSDIDVVQAVGRVMRKEPGKRYGYIILPIAQAPGVTDEESLNASAYRAVWQVINAISAHDDRFEAIINQFALSQQTQKPPRPDYSEGGDIAYDDGSVAPTAEEQAIQGILQIAGSPELRDAILAKVVDKYADPRYWEKWASTVREIAQNHETRIRALLNGPDETVRDTFDNFLAGIRNNLNDGITEDDAVGMLSQHLITKPVFDALFADYAFAQHNPVSQSMEGTIDALAERGLEKETAGLDNFYRDVRVRAQGVTDASGKQSIIAELYERFLKLALPETAARLGIVYTPTPVVDYIVRSVEDVLQAEFGVSVSDEGVHVIDPFTGTGSFITRLMHSGLINGADLPRKYAKELHANDIMLLAYYIAAINIEATYHDRANADEYSPFEGIVLTDTFQSAEEGDPMDEALFPRNNARIERQKALDIRVIIGNPPWSATNTRRYPNIDGKIQRSYAEPSVAKQKQSLYDPYVRAIRHASDRVNASEKGGIVAFVTNGGFIDSNAFDGFRKALAEEFHAVYCYNLRGDQRTAGEQSRREGGKIFGSGSRASVAILILVKKPGPSAGARIYYRDIGDYLTREAKLDILDKSGLRSTEWQVITPDAYGDWIGQRDENYQTMRLLVGDQDTIAHEIANTPIFNLAMPGVNTARDAYCYNSSEKKLKENVKKLAKEKGETLTKSNYRVGVYRPFFKQQMCYHRKLNARPSRFNVVFPDGDSKNLGISILLKGANSPFHSLMTESIPDLHLTADTLYLPRYRYIPASVLTKPPDPDNPELERVSNINLDTVAQFRAYYNAPDITEDDLFYYTYGVLHSRQWRATFADDLAKSPARIPMAPTAEDFHAFTDAGRKLADLHVNYESVEPWTLNEIHAEGWDANAASAYRVEKMSYGGRRPNLDTTRIIYNAGITLAGIPAEAHEYRLGSRSALDWLIDRYQVRTHNASGIVNDPNDWCAEQGNPRYILDLVKRITTVSVRTVEIVRGLPEFPDL